MIPARQPYKASGRYAGEAAREVDSPRAGYFRLRLRKGAPYVPARIWIGPPRDPLTGELLDRSYRPIVQIANFPATDDPEEVARVWHYGETIDPATFAYMRSRAEWARLHDPEAPAANPLRPVDLSTMRPPF